MGDIEHAVMKQEFTDTEQEGENTKPGNQERDRLHR